MKKILTQISALVMVMIIGTIACKKADIIAPSKAHDFRFVVNNIGATAPPAKAIVSLRNSNGQEVVSNKTLGLSGSNSLITEKIELPAGQYALTKFLLLGSNDKVEFAAPVAGSAKASLVQKPLSLFITLPGTATQDLNVEVLAVTAADKAESFGYQPGTFQESPGETMVSIRLQAVIGVGSIIYDSIPAQWRIISWDANNHPHQKDTLLPAGTNTIRLPATHTRFQVSMAKWGITDAMTLTRDQLQENIVYTLGGTKAAKKLRREESFLLVMGSYQPSAKAIYSYNTKGLQAVEYYQKKPQWMELQFTQRQQYLYSGNNVSRIEMYDSGNTMRGYTDFTYNDQGTKLTHMHQKMYDVETFAGLEHSSLSGFAYIGITYLYNNGNVLQYKMKIRGGNKIEDEAMSSTGAGEGGTYTYDQGINPYAHMNMPDIFLSNLSRNNLISQQKNYAGSIPSAELYKLDYTYDADGYPTEVIKYYKNFRTGEHAYQTKTVYTYM